MRSAWLLVLLGCDGAGDAAGDAAVDAAGQAVDATVVGGLTWRTEATQEGHFTEFSGPAGAVVRVVWRGETVQIEGSNRPTLGPLAVGVVPADGAAAERGALLLYGAYVADQGGGVGQPFTGLGIVGNHAGCDDIDLTPGLVSCGRGPLAAAPGKGGCCDVHDACISTHCTGEGDSGNVVKCLNPLSNLECSPACTACHQAVVRCFVAPEDQGPSVCCTRGDCGEAQQCMIDDVVETDACVCAAAGVPSADACP
jgi:hypothetical protein